MEHRKPCRVTIFTETEGGKQIFSARGVFWVQEGIGRAEYVIEGDDASLTFGREALEMRRGGVGLSSRFQVGAGSFLRSEYGGQFFEIPADCMQYSVRRTNCGRICDLVYKLSFSDSEVFYKLRIFIVISEVSCK